jgi:predicted DsbA family dithiol-disulfide isomerase
MEAVNVEIWSDVVCPWCYLGKRRFEAALARFEHRDEVEVTWRSFELDPSTPRELDESATDALATKYGMTREQAEATHAQMTELAASEGLEYHFDRARRGNTFDAHRLIQMGAAAGLQEQVTERLFRGYFTDGEPIGDHDALVRLAGSAGLDADAARAALTGDAYADAVRADEALAQRFGIRGVPYFVLGRRYGVSGAQPPELLLQALERAWADIAAVSG